MIKWTVALLIVMVGVLVVTGEKSEHPPGQTGIEKVTEPVATAPGDASQEATRILQSNLLQLEERLGAQEDTLVVREYAHSDFPSYIRPIIHIQSSDAP